MGKQLQTTYLTIVECFRLAKQNINTHPFCILAKEGENVICPLTLIS